jgi:hypothetical protein
MKLWVISQDVNRGYDTYDSAVVAAETEEEARNILPSGDNWDEARRYGGWASKPSEVTVEYLGVTDRDISGVVLSSFNAG